MKHVKIKLIVEEWNKRNHVISVELGGLGLEYERAIQNLVFAICDKCREVEFTEAQFNVLVDDLLFNKQTNFNEMTGAQVGAAKQLAHKYLTTGYIETINDESLKGRFILIAKRK